MHEPTAIKRRAIPGPGRIASLRTGLRMMDDPLGTLEALHENYGPVAILRTGVMTVVSLADPELIGEILQAREVPFHKGGFSQQAKPIFGEGLITSEGDAHRHRRAAAQPAFQPRRLAPYAPTMVEEAKRIADDWHEGQIVDVPEAMSLLTVRIAARTLFGTNLDDEADAVRSSLNQVQDAFMALATPVGQLTRHLPSRTSRRFARGKETLQAIVDRLIDDRQAGGEDRGDVLSMLLDAHGDDHQAVRDDVVGLLLAGNDTTASALAFIWGELARNPHVAETMRAEIASVVGDRDVTVDDLQHLDYTRRVFLEALRLWPAIFVLDRQATRRTVIGPWRIKPSWTLVLPTWIVHRDPRWYDDPLRFDPDRHLPAATEVRPRYAYIPFGGGRRICIGSAFATMEALIAVATIAQRWRLEETPDSALEPYVAYTLRPDDALRLRVQPA